MINGTIAFETAANTDSSGELETLNSPKSHEILSPRKEFPETWIWSDALVGFVMLNLHIFY